MSPAVKACRIARLAGSGVAGRKYVKLLLPQTPELTTALELQSKRSYQSWYQNCDFHTHTPLATAHCMCALGMGAANLSFLRGHKILSTLDLFFENTYFKKALLS